MLQPVNKEYAKLKQLPRGALWINHALIDGPAALAGAEDGDLIVELEGRPLRLSGSRALDYFNKMLRPKVGRPFELTVLRDGKRKTLSGTFAKRPEEEKIRAEDIGVTVTDVTDEKYHGNNLYSREGVMVIDVHKGSPAATSSSFGRNLLRSDDVIVEMYGRPTKNLEEFSKVLEGIRRDEPEALLVRYWRGCASGYAGLNLKIGKKGKGDAQ